MKIGILTFWWSEDNYGQILQCYALQKYLRDVGHDVFLIRYRSTHDYIKLPIWRKIIKAFNPIKLYGYLLSNGRRIADKRDNSRNRNFEDFRNKHIKQSPRIFCYYKELVQDPPLADVYIVGSDQVWNISEMSVDRAVNVINAYLLNFGDALIRRISYAASFGKNKGELDSSFIGIFASLLKKFDYISVREKSGLEICRQCGIDNAEWVPDPTMLLDTGIYRALYRNGETIRKPDKPYCFLYLLGNKFDFSIDRIYNWAQGKKIEIVYVSGNLQHDNFKKTYATIPEWIYLLENAEYVVTNSYHCAVFSLLFKKKFGVIPLVGRDIGMNSRFDSMFQLFNIENRFLKDDFSVLDMEIDVEVVSDIFQNIRDTCKLNEIIQRKR